MKVSLDKPFKEFQYKEEQKGRAVARGESEV